jgi:hypothetical protein
MNDENLGAHASGVLLPAGKRAGKMPALPGIFGGIAPVLAHTTKNENGFANG